MRIRTIKPEFFRDEQLAELTMGARILFIGLWCLADRDGRLEDRPKRIQVELLPYDDQDVEVLLNELAGHQQQFIVRYEAEGKRVIQIRTFEKHQRISGKESDIKSVLPRQKPAGELPKIDPGSTGEAPGKHPGSTGEAKKADGEAPEGQKHDMTPANIEEKAGEALGKQRGSTGEAPGSPGREGKGKEGEGGEGKGGAPTTLIEEIKNRIRACRPEYQNLREDLIENTLKDVAPEFWEPAVKDFVRDQERALVAENNPLKILSGYLYHASTKSKKEAPGAALDPNKRVFVSARPGKTRGADAKEDK